MKKGEFLIKYNVAVQVSEQAFNKLGLAAKRFTKAYADEYSDLADEEHFVRKDFAIVEGEGVNKKAKTERLQNGAEVLVKDDAKEKELRVALKAWKKEEISFKLDKHKPIELTKKLLVMSAPIFEELNGFVFIANEEEYLEALDEAQSEEIK